MTVTKRRILGYLALSLGLALVLGPYTFKRKIRYDGPALLLSAQAVEPSALRMVCPEGTVPIADGLLDSLPYLRTNVNSLGVGWPSMPYVYLKSAEIAGFMKRLGWGGKPAGCFRCKDRVFRLIHTPYLKNRGDLYLVGLPRTAIGRVLSDKKGLLAAEDALTPYWEILSRPVETRGDLIRDPESREEPVCMPRRVDLPAEEWFRLLGEIDAGGGTVVKVGGFMVRGEVKEVHETAWGDTPWLLWVRLALGGLLFIPGLWAMGGAYARKPGIKVNPDWAAKFADVVFILFTAAGAYAFWEVVQYRWLAVEPFLDDEAARVVMAMMYAPTLLILALYASQLASQSLEVTEAGVVRHGTGKPVFMAWDDIDSLALADTYLPVGRGGFLMARKLQTCLVFETREGRVTLFEPGTKEIKRNIVGDLRRHGPERLKQDMETIERKW